MYMTQGMKDVTLVLGVAVVIVGVLGVGMQIASAYRGDSSTAGPRYSEERHEAMERALEDGDYEAWRDIVEGRGRVTEVVTVDNFDEFVRAHELAEEGNFEGARKIRQELGLGYGQRHNRNGGVEIESGMMHHRFHQNSNR